MILEAKLVLSLLDFVCIKARDFTAAFAFLNQTLGLSFLSIRWRLVWREEGRKVTLFCCAGKKSSTYSSSVFKMTVLLFTCLDTDNNVLSSMIVVIRESPERLFSHEKIVSFGP